MAGMEPDPKEPLKKHLINIKFADNIYKPVWTLEINVPQLYHLPSGGSRISGLNGDGGGALKTKGEMYSLPLEGKNGQSTLVLLAYLEDIFQRETFYHKKRIKNQPRIELYRKRSEIRDNVMSSFFLTLKEFDGKNKRVIMLISEQKKNKEVILGIGGEKTNTGLMKDSLAQNKTVLFRPFMKLDLTYLPPELQRFLYGGLS